MKYYNKRMFRHFKSTVGVILRPVMYQKEIYEQLKIRLPYEPTKKQIRWCYIDFLRYKIKYNGSLDTDYFNSNIYKKSEFVRKESLANDYRFFFRDSIQDNENSKIFQNKILFYDKFKKYLGRKYTVIEKNSSTNDIIDEINKITTDKIIFAKLPLGYGGKEVFLINVENPEDIKKLKELSKKSQIIVEEKIKQNEILYSFSNKSVNTLRIITIVDDNNIPHIAAAVFRMGVGNANVDNFSSGGILAPIDIKSGVISGAARDKYGIEYIYHPSTNKQIVGFSIPYWEKYKAFAMKLAMIYPNVRYIGWDIIMDDNGKLCLIEGNKDAGVQSIESNIMFGLKPYYSAIVHNDINFDFNKYRL